MRPITRGAQLIRASELSLFDVAVLRKQHSGKRDVATGSTLHLFPWKKAWRRGASLSYLGDKEVLSCKTLLLLLFSIKRIFIIVLLPLMKFIERADSKAYLLALRSARLAIRHIFTTRFTEMYVCNRCASLIIDV